MSPHQWATYFQAGKGDIPHLLFYGPAGSGKKVRIMALLRAVFGPGVDRVSAATVRPE